MTKRKLTLEQARNQYPHRFTAEHVPHWAKTPLEGGKHYAPQYRTDAEWYANTAFPGEPNHPLPGDHACYSTGQTFPFGLWLAEPYRKGKEPKPWQAPIAKGFSRWAAFLGTANGQEITLHETEREALEHVAESLGIQFNDPDDPQQVRDDDELRDAIEDHCNDGADDWHIQELEILDIPEVKEQR